MQFVADHLEVGGGGEGLGEEAVGFVFGSGVVGAKGGFDGGDLWQWEQMRVTGGCYE